ncbi:MAG: hypothetical protein J5I65_00210 [Aridibacter famidurans]|nr:hypothetical protein [Aridibacter famidurans]
MKLALAPSLTLGVPPPVAPLPAPSLTLGVPPSFVARSLTVAFLPL